MWTISVLDLLTATRDFFDSSVGRAEDCTVHEVILRSLVRIRLEGNFCNYNIICFYCCVFDKNIISFEKTRATRDEQHGRH